MKPSIDIAAKVKDFRELRNLTQQGLADLSGIPMRTIQTIEAGGTNPNLETLTMLSDAGIPVSSLFKTPSFFDAISLLEAYRDSDPRSQGIALALLSGDPKHIPISLPASVYQAVAALLESLKSSR